MMILIMRKLHDFIVATDVILRGSFPDLGLIILGLIPGCGYQYSVLDLVVATSGGHVLVGRELGETVRVLVITVLLVRSLL